MKIKNIFSILLLLLVGCSPENEVIPEASPLEDLKAVSGDNQVILSWTNSELENLSHVEIIILGISSDYKETIKHEVSNKNSVEVISVPTGNNTYKFILTPFGVSGKRYAPVEIKGKPFTNDTQAGMDALLSNLRMESVSNGVKLSWSNSNNISCLIVVSYTEGDSQKTVELDAKSAIPVEVIKLSNQGSDFVVFIKGTDDAEGVNSTSSRTEFLQPNKPYMLSKERFSIYSVSSQAATEGNGSAACAIDENLHTRWLATKKGGPDSIIIDLGKPVVIERLALARYFGNSDNSAWDVTFSVGNNPNLPTWEHEFSYANSKDGIFKIEFNRGNDGDQFYPLPEPITAQYVKYRTDRMSSSFATHYGEISVYGYYVD